MHEPKLTHLQFSILGYIAGGAASGKEIRAALKRDGMRRSGPAFYQVMSRLEDAGWVKGDYRQQVIDGQIIRERFYDLTPAGTRAQRLSAEFYSEWMRRLSHRPAPA